MNQPPELPPTPAAEGPGAEDPGEAFRLWIRSQPWARWLGLALRAVGVLGLVVSVALVAATPIATGRAIPAVRSGLHSGAEALVSLADTLDQASQALGSAAEVLQGTGQGLRSVEQSIANTQPLIESVAGLVGESMRATIEGTQRTLETAADGAQAIDQVLRGLGSLSTITGISYDPEHSLEQSLTNAADGLRPIPAALQDIQRDLDNVGGELDTMRGRLSGTASDMDQLAGDLKQFDRDLGQRADGLRDLADRLDRAADSAKLWMWGVALVVELLLVGVAATQLMVYRAGRELSRPVVWPPADSQQAAG